ncbi:type II/IV secretion system ATPase subunit [Candidatus Woesearchaeota archaeon]|nr:type II/IV secretion system ATPase subunit [Candidatus Woesearchaeota archaeon]
MVEDKDYTYEIIREPSNVVLKVDYRRSLHPPSIEDDELCMSRTIGMLLESSRVTKIIFTKNRDFEYDYSQVKLLYEIVYLYNKFVKDHEMTTFLLTAPDELKKETLPRQSFLQRMLYTDLRKDPIGAYIQLIREHREQYSIYQNNEFLPQGKIIIEKFIHYLEYIIKEFEKTTFIRLVKPFLSGYKLGDRSVYKNLFRPIIKPDFMFTKLMAQYPEDGDIIGSYKVNDTDVTIFQQPGKVTYYYHIMPPEFKLTEEKYEILDTAREVLGEHKPKRSEFVNPNLMREIFYNVGKDLIEELANKKGVVLRLKELEQLTNILVRYTVGFGLIEVLLEDNQIQDISINSPMGNIPMFIVHGEFGDCITNIIPNPSDGESWATKLRLISGRPLDGANPILDTEIELPGARARIAVIAPPLNPTGLAYSWRRHRIKPWTLPLFIKYRMINSMAAGLISFLIDGSRTMLVAGTRSAGKSSLLGGVLVDIMRRARIITIEDTLELPSDALRDLGYNIQSMKVASSFTKGTNEISAEDGIRTTLRLGDSALFVGEVRSGEAKALYEAMRVGALANVVAGTIHGDSPYGVYDRVVNDLGVPRTSFKATDIIIVANPIRSPDGIHRWRRVTQITEVRKHWTDDPLREGGFVDLMKYDAERDELVLSDELINGESEIIKAIAGNVKEWAGDWDAVWDNILLRTKVREKLVKVSEEEEDNDILEAEFVIDSNDAFHKISEKIRDEIGYLDSEKIYFEWENWLKESLARRRHRKNGY